MVDCRDQPIRIPRPWVEGDQTPALGTFTLPNGLLVSDHTIELHIDRPDGTELIKTASDLGGSQFQFTWDVGDLIAGSGQLARLYVTPTATGERESIPPGLLLDVEGPNP